MARHEAFNSQIEELLRDDPSNWDRLIANDLAAELKHTLGDGPDGIPEIRRFLAVKGFRALKVYLDEAVADQVGEAAIRAVIRGMRDFARLRPGLSAATFRSAVTDCPEWREAGKSISDWLCRLLVDQGLSERDAQNALRMIRAFVRGFVIHEMQGSFLDNADLEECFVFGVDTIIRGLPTGRAPSP